MNNQLVTEAIILSRTDFGEADRIITLLTPQYGKLRLMAKGVRRVKSKLAGGIELFSISSITFVKGRGDIGTLVSTRLKKHYGHIVEDLDRTMLGYELIKQLNKATEDEPEPEYFALLHEAFDALDDFSVSTSLVRLWFSAQLLRLAGHSPNLQTDSQGKKLHPDRLYDFDFESMSLAVRPGRGQYRASHIKFLRLIFAAHAVKTLAQVGGADELVNDVTPLAATMLQTHIRV